MLLTYNCILLKMSTWYSKHVEENIWRINNIKCITLVFLYGQFMMHGQRNIKKTELNENSLSCVFPFIAVEISDLDSKWPSYKLIPRYCSSSQLCCHRFKSVFTPGRLTNCYQIERTKQTKRLEFSCRILLVYNVDILGSYCLWRIFFKRVLKPLFNCDDM